MDDLKSDLRVLLVEDSWEIVAVLQQYLESWGYFVRSCHVQNASEMGAALDDQTWDLVLADHVMPEFDSIEALEMVKKRCPDVPLIVVSGKVDDDFANEVMRAGARDFVSKSNLTRLRPVIDRELREARGRRDSSQLKTTVGTINQQLEDTVTTLTKTQEQLVRMERFKALGQMASGVAHDFNNALTKMIGIIELSIAQSEERVEPLEQLRVTALDAANIVRRLRAFYQPLNAATDAEALDINKVIEAAVDLTKPKWKAQSAANGYPITVKMDLEAVSSVAGKFTELQEAFANLIFNACDALPEGGEISISTWVAGDAVVVAFKDEGIGMSEDTCLRCLEPYFTTKGRTRTGMGLALVDGLIRRHGGILECESGLGTGTTFTMKVPVYVGCEEDADPEEDSPAAIAPIRILVADDDLAVSILLSQFLRIEGHEVDLAKNGQVALEIFDPERHQLVITDRAMPVLNGDLLAAAIKSRSPETPVIMASGFVDAVSTDGENPFPVDYLLRKPITREDLRRALAKVSPAS